MFDADRDRAWTLARHGGRLRDAMALFPDAPRPWLDLSTGVNPRSYPAPRATRQARARLPDVAAIADLERAAAQAFGAAPERVCAVAGADSALRLLPSLLQTRHVAIAPHTYGGHAEAWRAAGAEIEPLADLRSVAPETAVIVVNPNNPNGAQVSRDDLVALHARAAKVGGWLVVDESFVEITPELSVATERAERLVVLRSFGKFYGLAGIRLGFVVAAPKVVAQLQLHLGDWPVSADAIAAGLAAYPDKAWRRRTRDRLHRDSQRLDRLLQRFGYAVVGGTTLFRLVEVDQALGRFTRLAGAGVLVRPFLDAPDRLRFGLPPAHGWRRLEAALRESAA